MLENMVEDAKAVREVIESEMVKKHGFKWQIWTGFHAVPSMEHVHLHVISSDLYSPNLKNKKHYNSFHPKLGFFLHLDEVMSWFEAEPSYFSRMSQLKPSQYEHLLKEPLCCWRCVKEFKNMPLLKAHLADDFDKEIKREKARLERKRKLAERSHPKDTAIEGEASGSSKRKRESTP